MSCILQKRRGEYNIMKYKDRKDAKRKYKQALLATVATMSLGVSALGSSISVFADESPTPPAIAQQTAQQGLDHMGYDQFYKWVLQRDEFLAPGINTQIKNITSTGKRVTEIFEFPLINDTNSDLNMTVPKRIYKLVDSLSSTSGREFSFGQEFSFEAGVKDVWKAAGKLTFGQKINSTETNLKSTEQTVEYGGNTYPVKAGQSRTVKFIYSQETFSGKAVNRRQITDYNSSGSSFTKWIGAIGINYWDGKNGTAPEWYRGDQDPTKLSLAGSRATYSSPHLTTAYDVFSLINKKDSNNYSTANLLMSVPTRTDSYTIPTYILKDKLDIDDAKKKVYIKEDETEFTGATGGQIIQQVVDNKTGETISYDIVASVPTISN